MGTRKLAIVIPGRIVVLSERVRFLTRRVELVVAQARWKARVNDEVQRVQVPDVLQTDVGTQLNLLRAKDGTRPS